MAAVALLAVPLLKGAVPVFVKIAAGGCWGSLIGTIDSKFLQDPENDVTKALHDWLKPAIDNVKDHVSKTVRAEFLACMDKLQNGLIYLSELESKQQKDAENRITDIAVVRKRWSEGLSTLNDKEMENVRYWFRKAHSSALKLSYNTQLELKWRLEAMSVVMFCMALEHVDNPERLVKAWRRQLAEFLKDEEIQNVLDNPTDAKFRDNLNTIREICYLVFAATRDMTMLALEEGAGSFEGYKLFVQNMAYGNTTEQMIALTNMAWECGVIAKKTRIVAYDAEKIMVTPDGKLTVMKRGCDIQFIFEKSTLTKEIENETHGKRINSIAGCVVEDTPMICIADDAGSIYSSWASRILFSEEIPSPPVASAEMEITVASENRLFAAVVQNKELYLFERRLRDQSNTWRSVFQEPEKWDGNSTINLKSFSDPESRQVHMIIYEKSSGWYGQTVLFVDLEGTTVVHKELEKIKCAFGSRKQRFAFSLSVDDGTLVAVNKERPNTKGGAVGVKLFAKGNYEKATEEQTVKPLLGCLRDVAACGKLIALAFYV